MPDTRPMQHAQPAASGQVRVDNVDEGIVTAVVSVTGTVDEVGDLIVPGAYRRTLSVRTPKVCHEHHMPHVTGRVLHIEELLPGDPRLPARTGRGKAWPKEAGALLATIQFNLNTELGREAFENVKFFGAEQAWSIGYKVVAGKATRRRDGVRVILDLDLWELSTVMWGAHLDTLALQVKSAAGAREHAEMAARDAADVRETRMPAVVSAAERDADMADADAADADRAEAERIVKSAVGEDGGDAGSVVARKRAAQKTRAAARGKARRAKDQATLAEMDRRDEWDRAIELETLAEQKRRSEYRRRYRIVVDNRVRRLDLAEDERVRRAQWQAQMRRWVRVETARRRKWQTAMRARSDALADAIRAIEAKTAAVLVAEVKGGVPRVADTPEDVASTRRLIRWYEHGEGAALIRWGEDGDFYRCVAIAGKHMTPEQAKGFCQNRHQGALGMNAGDHDGDGKRDKKSHPAEGLEWKAMTQMRGSFEDRRDKIDAAVNALMCPPRPPADPGGGPAEVAEWVSVDATFDTYVYVTVYQGGGQRQSFQVPYTVDGDGEVSLGEPTEVTLQVVATQEGGYGPVDDGVEADHLRYLTPALTGFGELASAVHTAGVALESKGGPWKQALADAARTLLSALEDAGVDLDEPELPVEATDDEPADYDDGDGPAGVDGDMASMEGKTGFGVLGKNDDDDDDDEDEDEDGGAPTPDEADTAAAPSTPQATAGADDDLDDAESGSVDADADVPAEPGRGYDGDSDDDGETDGVESAAAGAPAADPATADPNAIADAGDSYTDDAEDDDEDDEVMGRKSLTLNPADVMADLIRLRG